jgi:cyclic pyranopterin phosphate synthase
MAELIDQFSRKIDYLRLSVTDRCDLRCSYCLPEKFHDFSEPDNWLTFDEISRVVGAFSRMGVSKVRVTGGEPLLRYKLPNLIEQLHALPDVEDLSLSTNATRLVANADRLKQAGVSRINVSLDSLQPERFARLTKGSLDKVLAGLMAAKAAGFRPVKINMVVMQGVNDDEVEDMIEFCIQHDFTLRFIEVMPMGDTGRNAAQQYISLQDIKARIAQRYELIPGVMPGGGPARYVQVAGTNLRIGFITPISQHFCETCNRVRLSAEGTLYMCLGQEHRFELRPLLRAGISDSELEQAIRTAIDLKPEKHEFKERPEKVLRFMAKLGG